MYRLQNVIIICTFITGILADEENQDFQCPSPRGYFAHEIWCDRYYICYKSDFIIETCKQGLLFDDDYKRCLPLKEAECGSRKIPNDFNESNETNTTTDYAAFTSSTENTEQLITKEWTNEGTNSSFIPSDSTTDNINTNEATTTSYSEDFGDWTQVTNSNQSEGVSDYFTSSSTSGYTQDHGNWTHSASNNQTESVSEDNVFNGTSTVIGSTHDYGNWSTLLESNGTQENNFTSIVTTSGQTAESENISTVSSEDSFSTSTIVVTSSEIEVNTTVYIPPTWQQENNTESSIQPSTEEPTPEPEEPEIYCPEEAGVFPHPTDQTKYIHCDAWFPYLKSCPSNLVFDPDLKVCTWPKNYWG